MPQPQRPLLDLGREEQDGRGHELISEGPSNTHLWLKVLDGPPHEEAVDEDGADGDDALGGGELVIVAIRNTAVSSRTSPTQTRATTSCESTRW